MSGPLLSVREVTLAFRGLRAVDGVSLDVPGGAIVGVIGPNGAGKSTLFDIVSGARAPQAGTVVFDGTDITGWPDHRVARAGLVRTFQLTRPFAGMTLLDNVAVAAATRHRRRRAAVREAAEVVERVGAGRWRDVPASALPMPALKRLELARALAVRPRLLLLDEVLAGLVPAEREPVLELIQELRADGLTVVFVEHVMAAVMRLSDLVVVLDQGRVLAAGEPGEVTRDPAVVAAYLGEEPPGAAP